ncbi:hypothetical protein P4361_05860 [Fictibacillus sp. B-59209]|uniref:hypothetical protein n=1 Tax=Fictibacillus sp. B-59209 TaxID=3024873 RepID=UPI002E1D2E22|nr:hypothetical protein [Fictibacillus sp. B-59209]
MASGVESFSAQLARNVWGHRFMDGQKGPEYVLEFLNVLVGTHYDLNSDGYYRKKTANFRQFVFEGDKEGSKNDIVSLNGEQKEILYSLMENEKEKIDVVREFFRNLEVPLYDGRGKEANRSWYAKSLYPIHESLLFFELRKNKGSISFERNFFARGGELYFLMLSYGTQGNNELKESLESKIKYLLRKNKSIESITKKFTDALDPENSESEPAPLKYHETREYPQLPVKDHPLFPKFAEELNNLLNLNIDIYEMFKLLTSLVCFQLLRYMQEQVEQTGKSIFFIDCMDGQLKQIQQLSSESFIRNESNVKEKFENEFSSLFNKNLNNTEGSLSYWKENTDEFLKVFGLSSLQKARKNRVIKTLENCKDENDISTKLFSVVKEVVGDQLKKHQLSIVRGIVRDGGIGGYRAGSKYRYYMSDDFLKTVVFSNISPKQELEYSGFLDMLYEKYGFVIGEKQAKASGIYENSRLNISYFQKNENSLREKLRQNGLLIEFSDATAMIHNPFESIENEVLT